MNQQPTSMTSLSNEEIDQVSGAFFCLNPFSIVTNLIGGIFGAICKPAPVCPPNPCWVDPGTDNGNGPRNSRR